MPTETPTSPEATLLAALHARDRWDYEQVVALADLRDDDEPSADASGTGR